MTNPPAFQAPVRTPWTRLRRTALGLAMAASLFAGTTQAQVLVTDSTAIAASEEGFKSQLAQTVAQYTKQGLQYAKQIEQYTTQLQQYQQMLTKVMNLGTNFSIRPNTMTEMDAGPLIQANCGTNTGSVIGNIVNKFTTSLMSQSVVSSQQQICAAIITTQVDKYNSTIQMMQQIQSNLSAVQKFVDLANSFRNMGESSSAATQIDSYSGQLSTAMSDWKARMDADDAYISSLQQMQGVLAKKALKGNPSILGNAVQAATFAAAFQ